MGLLLLTAAAVAAFGLAVGLRGKPVKDAIRRGVFIGVPLMDLRAPIAEVSHPQGGLTVLVRFADQDRVAHGTFRCLLNGRDLTHQLTRGRNGAGGSIFPLREGSNRLRLEVFGRGWMGRRYYREVIERVIEVRPLPLMERAGTAGPSTAA